MHKNILLLITILLIGCGDDSNKWTQAACVKNCMASDEYIPELGGTLKSICGSRMLRDHCECGCIELESMGANMYLGETDLEAEQATLNCMNTELMECIMREVEKNNPIYNY